jgi:NAD(P)H dehydrogenase (quinone)
MSLVVTGATGALGSHVITHLLDRGAPPTEVVAGGRNAQRLAALADRGVRTARMDYDDPASLEAAFGEGDRVLLVSGSEVGQRVAQHRNVVDAAVSSGVALLAYTSILNADDNPVSLAEEHRATESVLTASGLPTVLLRNGWYLENYTGQLATYQQTGSILGAAGDGRIAAATRFDFAEAAAVVLAEGEHSGRVYELGGEPFTLAQLADAITTVTDQNVAYRDVSLAELRQTLSQLGLPGQVVAMLVSADAAIASGALDTTSTDLAELIGRRPTTMHDAVSAAASA